MHDDVAPTRSIDVALNDGRVLALQWYGATDTGRRRDTNQDSFFAEFPLFIVADGMGGHVGGEIASSHTTDRLGALAGHSVTRASIEEALAHAVHDIAGHPDATEEGTGTTVTGVFLDAEDEEPSWLTLNIGDSRVYLLRDGVLVQATTDHSVVQELLSAGKISEEEAENHPYGNVITRAVGAVDGAIPDYVRVDIRDGDRFVICSDGLTKELTDYGIRHFLEHNADPRTAVEGMLEAALDNGGRDNVTIIVVNVSVHASEAVESSHGDAGDLGEANSPSTIPAQADA